MGDLNARIGSSDTHLKAVGRYTYHQVFNDISVKQITSALQQPENIIQTGTMELATSKWQQSTIRSCDT